jgi:hypothetical protein
MSTSSSSGTLDPDTLRTLRVVGGVAGIIGGALGTYHGYARNHSIGWALAWGALGSLAPVIVVPIALAQGLGKPRPGAHFR